MNKLMTAMTVAVAAMSLWAATPRNKKPAADADQDASGTKANEVVIKQFPNLGKQSLRTAPNLISLNQYFTKPRQWIVLELAYDTRPRNIETLTFTWHVVLDAKTASNKELKNLDKDSPYSYFTTTTTYKNIPRGTHAASVVLHPSYYECYGEPCAVSVVISDSTGQEIGGKTDGNAPFRKKNDSSYKFWEDENVMNKPFKGDILWVSRRQGLQDRSKTIWALVNPNDYELTQQ